MAAADPEKNIKDQFSCSICLDLFQDPVSADCGHSFCKKCITRICKEEGVDIACPLCKKMFQKRSLRPNWELKKIMDSLPQFSYPARINELIGGNTCQKHREPLNLYCKEDQTPVCVTCERTRPHRTHSVIPLQKAIEEYRETVTEQLETIESNFEKLHLTVNKVWKNLPQNVREKEHERLNALIDKIKTHFKVESESSRKRFEDRASQTEPPDSQSTSSCPNVEIAVETALHREKDRENMNEESSEKQKTASHDPSSFKEAVTSTLVHNQTSLDSAIHEINKTKDGEHKVDGKDSEKRSEEQTSPKKTMESGERRKDSGRNVAIQPEYQGSKEKAKKKNKKKKKKRKN